MLVHGALKLVMTATILRLKDIEAVKCTPLLILGSIRN